MATSFDPLRGLGPIPDSHHERIRFLAEADRSVISTIQLGILFVMAFWSGSSRTAFARLKKVLSEVDSDGRLELVVVDTDGCPDLYEAPEFLGNLHGNGETAWIDQGRIVAVATGGSAPDATEVFTRRLLESATQS
jgi:hypothetical protein